MGRNLPYPFYSLSFWRCYLVHLRPYLMFLSGIAGLAGIALIPSPSFRELVLIGLPLFFAYGVGQALTDAFQTDTDAISSPYRPLVRGEITPRTVIAVSVIGLLAGSALFAFQNPWILAPALLSVVGLATYTPFKRTWWGGPPWNSWIVALLPVMGRMADPAFSPAEALARGGGRLSLTVAALFFAYANFVVGGYFKDITADRTTGYQTFQVRFGWRAGAIYSDLVSLLAAGFTLLALWPALSADPFGAFAAGFAFLVAVGLNLAAQIMLHRTRDEAQAHRPIAHIVRCFLLYAMALILVEKPAWWPQMLAYYACFEWALAARPEETQI